MSAVQAHLLSFREREERLLLRAQIVGMDTSDYREWPTWFADREIYLFHLGNAVERLERSKGMDQPKGSAASRRGSSGAAAGFSA